MVQAFNAQFYCAPTAAQSLDGTTPALYSLLTGSWTGVSQLGEVAAQPRLQSLAWPQPGAIRHNNSVTLAAANWNAASAGSDFHRRGSANGAVAWTSTGLAPRPNR